MWSPRGILRLPRMTSKWTILCESPELALDLQRDSDRIDLSIDCPTSDAPWQEALEHVGRARTAIAAHSPPTANQLVAIAEASRAIGPLPVAILGPERVLRSLAHDLGIVAVEDTGPLVAAIALLGLELERPWAPTTKELTPTDAKRVGHVVSHRTDGALIRVDDGLIGHADTKNPARPLGIARDVAAALYALRCAQETTRPRVPVVQGVDKQAVLDVILGPARALSDPASKAALAPYDVPLPVEELCTTPSRAAAEAARIGFPVRVALASPDLRIWEHPDLTTADVSGAAGVREAYRQLMALAQTRSSNARLLGVTVSAATAPTALLRVRLEPLDSGLALTEIGFADAHGVASLDATLTILPTTVRGLERVLARLEGSSLILRGNAADRKHAVSAIGDVLLRLAAFVHEWRAQVASVEVNPLAVLVGGEIEVREACVTVGDAFTRSLQVSG